MARSSLYLLLVAGVSAGAPAPAPEKVAAPKSGPPQFQWVQSVDKINETISVGHTVLVAHFVTKTVEKTQNINGQPVQVFIEVKVPEYRTETRVMQLSLKGVTGSTGAGKKLTKDELWNELKGNRIILVTNEGEELDPAYRSLLTKEALILHMPKPEPGTVTLTLPDVLQIPDVAPAPLPPIDKP